MNHSKKYTLTYQECRTKQQFVAQMAPCGNMLRTSCVSYQTNLKYTMLIFGK